MVKPIRSSCGKDLKLIFKLNYIKFKQFINVVHRKYDYIQT